MSKGLKLVLKNLLKTKEDIQAKTADARKKRDELLEKIRPHADEAKKLTDQIKAAEQPILGETQIQINALAKTLRLDPNTVKSSDLDEKEAADPKAEDAQKTS